MPAAAEEEELVPVAELEKDEDMVAAATKIQAVHRGRAARKGLDTGATEKGGDGEAAAAEAPVAAEEEELVPVAELEKDEDMVAAATKIQAVHRGRAARKGLDAGTAEEGGETKTEALSEAVQAPAAPKEKLQADAAPRPASGTRSKFCDYMAAHGMEARLRTALRELNDARPDDPAAFVAHRLLGRAV